MKNYLYNKVEFAKKQIVTLRNLDALSYVIKYNYLMLIIIILFSTIFAYVIVDRDLTNSKNSLTYELKYNPGIMKLCDYGYNPDKNIFYDYKLHKSYMSKKRFMYFKNNKLYLPISVKGFIFYVNITNDVIYILLYSIIFYIIVLLMSLWYTYIILTNERLSYMFSLHGKETAMQHEMLFNIVSNINHEVTSPLLVLRSSTADIKLEIDEFTELHVDDINDRRRVTSDFLELYNDMSDMMELMDSAIDQIYDTLNTLSDYNNIKFTNGDQNLYMLCDIAVRMLNRTNITNIKNVTIDPLLKQYAVSHYYGMSNGFFLNTMINHIKNSLEAGCDRLELKVYEITDKDVYIDIVDNGSGISQKIKDRLFELDVTTKNSKLNKRGSGLYINKILLKNKYHSDVSFISSHPYVKTVFRLKIKYDKYKH